MRAAGDGRAHFLWLTDLGIEVPRVLALAEGGASAGPIGCTLMQVPFTIITYVKRKPVGSH